MLGRREILGVSHLVLGTGDLAGAERFLSRCGLSKYGEIAAGANPLAKGAFVAGALAKTFDMKLMVGPNASPAVELLCENGLEARVGSGGPAVFEAVLAPSADVSPAAILETLRNGNACSLPGFREVEAGARPAIIAAMIVHCTEVETAVRLWNALGYTAESLDRHVARIGIRGVLPGNRLSMYFVADRPNVLPTYLNDRGFNCVSMFCHSAERLRAGLMGLGYRVGDCFTMAPFGRSFRVFFARNHSGELYEFLSLARH